MKLISLLLSTLLLAACGGGGGGTAVPAGPVASTSTFQLKQAFINDFNDTKTYPFTVSGTLVSGGNTGTVAGNGLLSRAAVVNVTFEGAAARSKTSTTTATISVTVGATTTTQTLAPTISTAYTSPANDLVGFTSPTSYATPSGAVAAIPVTAKVGDSGTLGTFNIYASAAKGAIQSTTAISWALTADTASTAILTFTQTLRNAGGVVTGTQVDSHRLTPAGDTTPINAAATLPSAGTITFTF